MHPLPQTNKRTNERTNERTNREADQLLLLLLQRCARDTHFEDVARDLRTHACIPYRAVLESIVHRLLLEHAKVRVLVPLSYRHRRTIPRTNPAVCVSLLRALRNRSPADSAASTAPHVGGATTTVARSHTHSHGRRTPTQMPHPHDSAQQEWRY